MNSAERAHRAWLRRNHVQLDLLTGSEFHAKVHESQPIREADSMASDVPTGTLRYEDGSEIQWEFVEAIPYEPSAYQWDAGIIVQVGDNCYFISTMTGDVYGQRDERWWDDGGSLTRLIENARCPEIDQQIADFERKMGECI